MMLQNMIGFIALVLVALVVLTVLVISFRLSSLIVTPDTADPDQCYIFR
ncbi:MAG: hypothetical protein ACFWTJ_11010 [Lachnoclostridium sp.]|jgi:hypothetical protein